MKDCTGCEHFNKDCDDHYKTCVFYIQMQMINREIEIFKRINRGKLK